jgi:hypothetical protein
MIERLGVFSGGGRWHLDAAIQPADFNLLMEMIDEFEGCGAGLVSGGFHGWIGFGGRLRR